MPAPRRAAPELHPRKLHAPICRPEHWGYMHGHACRGMSDGGAGGAKMPPRRGASAVLPYRGGGDEPGMLPGFVQNIMEGGIDELVIGIDRDTHGCPELADAAARYPGRVRAAVVPASPDWGFRFAAVVWHLIGEARHDLVLVTNIDEVPSRGALGPTQKVGTDDRYVLESGPVWSGGGGARTQIYGWTGTFWLSKPALGRYFDLPLYKSIRDGGDAFFFTSAVAAGLRYHVRPEPWIRTVRKGHMELGWFRWKVGLRESAAAQDDWSKVALYRRAARNFVAMRRILADEGRPYLAGWISAMLRPNSYWVRQSRALSGVDWVYQGRLPYDDLWRRWWRRAPSSRAVVVHGGHPRAAHGAGQGV